MKKLPELSAVKLITADFKFPIKKLFYQNKDHQTVYDVIEHPGSAIIIPVTGQGNIIAIKQFRYAVNRELIELPAGTLDAGEEPLTCAQREIMEETGYAAGKFTYLGEILPGPGLINEVQHVFLAEELYPQKLAGDDDEIIENLELSREDFIDKIKNGEIVDAKSIAAFYKYLLGAY